MAPAQVVSEEARPDERVDVEIDHFALQVQLDRSHRNVERLGPGARIRVLGELADAAHRSDRACGACRAFTSGLKRFHARSIYLSIRGLPHITSRCWGSRYLKGIR